MVPCLLLILEVSTYTLSQSRLVSSLFSCLAEVGFYLRGMFLSATGSRVWLSDIGEGSHALFCLTDRQDNRGTWRVPNNNNINKNSPGGFYSGRGSSSILLNRRSNATGPTGMFKCSIPADPSETLLFIEIIRKLNVMQCIVAVMQMVIIMCVRTYCVCIHE